MNINIDCGRCQGSGMGCFSPKCQFCKGKGYHKVDTSDPEWIEHCSEENLDPETGEEKERENDT